MTHAEARAGRPIEPTKARTPGEFRVMSNLPRLPGESGGRRVANREIGPVGLGNLGGLFATLWRATSCDAVIVDQAGPLLYLLCALRLLPSFGRTRLVSVDLVLSRPGASRLARVKARLKAVLFRKVDLFIVFMKDASGMAESYRIPFGKLAYVPFKVNSTDHVVRSGGRGGDYVITCGQSKRDFGTFCVAMSGLDIPGVILTPRPAEGARHGTHLDESLVPGNVRVVHDDGSAESWVGHIADSKMLVLCIAPETISPSGVGAYLVAMALKKCVVITDCPASRGILEHGVEAVIVPPRDPAALRDVIAEYWRDDQKRDAIAERGFRHATSLGDEDTLYKNIIATVIDRFGG